MHCPACVLRVEGLEDDLPGIKSVRASYRDQRVQVEYDESRISEKEIIAALEEMGYTVSR